MTGPGPSEIASAAGHALNNILAYLYAASSYLDEGDVDPARARAAVEDACRGASALSAALSLLGMTRDNVAGVPAFGQILDANALDRAIGAIGEVPEPDRRAVAFPAGPHAATLDADTLAALILCAATMLRRSAGTTGTLRISGAAAAGGPGSVRFAVRLWAVTSSGGPAPRRASHGPCELALAHVATILPDLGATLALDDDGAIELALDLRVAGDGDGGSGGRR